MIRVGVMGCASIAERSMIPAILQLPDFFKLQAIASRSVEKATLFANKFGAQPIIGYQELLDNEDVDIIYMPLPTGLHEEWVKKSLMAGKHVLVEKSLALNYESANRMTDLASEKGVLLMESFMFTHHSQHKYVQQILEEKGIGEIRLFRSQFGFPPLDYSNFRYFANKGGGSLLDAGAYTIKASQLFLGNDLEFLNAVLFIDPRLKVDIYGNATFINKEGIVAQLSFGFDNYYQCNYEFWGSTGRLHAEKAFTPKPNEQPKILFEKAGKKEQILVDADNHFVKILSYFNDILHNGNYQKIIKESLAQSRLINEIQENAIRIYL